jgi:ribosomal protein S6--L-glutamate ligase
MDLKVNLMVQEFVKEANCEDIRCFVVGDKVIAGMKRKAKEGDFRSNLHRGGSAGTAELSKEEIQTAIKATKSLGLNVAGVDMLRSKNGPVILEVNSSPGLNGIEKTTGIDTATPIIEFIETMVK